ncbi:MAG: hypothetical protein ABJ000_05755 [Saccharospirillum sp.]|uniref:hypothetical protein n=1 Tax=Saccharospirillum sp. TaxID=2033801 RepID=UPI003299558B
MAQIIELPIDGFSLKEAVTYLNFPVADKAKTATQRYKISELGIIVGVLTMNDEVELIIKIADGVEQLTRSEFTARFEVVND